MSLNKRLIFWFFFYLLGIAILVWLIFSPPPKYLLHFFGLPIYTYYITLACVILLIILSWIGAAGSTFTIENILNNHTRAMIFTLISMNPGIHFSEITKSLDLSNGQASWHILLLKRFELIRSVKSKNYLLFYPNITFIYDEEDSKDHSIVLKSETRNKIFELICDNPHITQNQLKKMISISQSTLSYHLAILEQEELIMNQKQGRRRFYYPKNDNN